MSMLRKNLVWFGLLVLKCLALFLVLMVKLKIRSGSLGAAELLFILIFLWFLSLIFLFFEGCLVLKSFFVKMILVHIGLLVGILFLFYPQGSSFLFSFMSILSAVSFCLSEEESYDLNYSGNWKIWVEGGLTLVMGPIILILDLLSQPLGVGGFAEVPIYTPGFSDFNPGYGWVEADFLTSVGFVFVVLSFGVLIGGILGEW